MDENDKHIIEDIQKRLTKLDTRLDAICLEMEKESHGLKLTLILKLDAQQMELLEKAIAKASKKGKP